jgi:hypothetical protein
MITCDSNPAIGTIALSGITPNGNGLVTRLQPGLSPFLLRGGSLPINTGGISLVDTEAPFGVPVDYVVQVSGITSANRLIQQNLMLTPTFKNGAQSWTAGANRTLTTPADSTAHSTTAVGNVTGTATTTTPTTPPSLIGHKDTVVTVSGSYTLDPATPSGGAAIATNDWMLIVHSQLGLSANPADPSGWTRVDDKLANNHRQIIWKRKRQAGDTSYVVAAAGSQSVGSLLWVRGSSDVITQSVTTLPDEPNVSTSIATAPHTTIRPSLVVSIFSVGATIGQRAGLRVTAGIRAEGGISSPTKAAGRGVLAQITASGQGQGPVSGATFSYMVNNVVTSTRTLIVATNAQTESNETPVASAQYGGQMFMGFASQFAFQVSDALTNRIIATTKAAVIPATTAAQPHMLTGRVKFTHPGLWTWQDVKNQGTWQNLKDTKADWLAVRGTSSTIGGAFLKFFVTIVDPGTGTDYIEPQQVIVGQDIATNSWIDFTMLFANTVDIPTTAEIRLVHGSTLKEYGITWRFDEFGITPGAQRAKAYNPLYWFDGSTAVPTDSAVRLMGPGWVTGSADAAITWAGTTGNSVSEFRTASTLSYSLTCQLDAPAVGPCEPVLLSDPVNTSMSMWVSLIGLTDLQRAARRGVYDVLNSSAPVAVSSRRQWEAATVTVGTSTLADRDQMNLILDSGRVLLLRNPDPSYPESGWYLSIGGVTESRPITDARHPERLWQLPYARVERPTGLIEVSGGVTWADVLAEGTWASVLAGNDSWLDVLDGED